MIRLFLACLIALTLVRVHSSEEASQYDQEQYEECVEEVQLQYGTGEEPVSADSLLNKLLMECEEEHLL